MARTAKVECLEPAILMGGVLMEARDLINGDRNDAYGDPAEMYERVAGMWGAYLNVGVSADDVTMLLTLMKIARQKHASKRDNLVDAAGYIALTAEIVGE